jgi:hypothetical protein
MAWQPVWLPDWLWDMHTAPSGRQGESVQTTTPTSPTPGPRLLGKGTVGGVAQATGSMATISLLQEAAPIFMT